MIKRAFLSTLIVIGLVIITLLAAFVLFGIVVLAANVGYQLFRDAGGLIFGTIAFSVQILFLAFLNIELLKALQKKEPQNEQ